MLRRGRHNQVAAPIPSGSVISATFTDQRIPKLPRKISRDFLQYISERPADFAKATTAREMAEGQNNQQNEIKDEQSKR